MGSKYYTVPAHSNTDKLENLYHSDETWRQTFLDQIRMGGSSMMMMMIIIMMLKIL